MSGWKVPIPKRAFAPLTFSAASESPLTFAVASSAAALSSPDIDSGIGLVQPESPSAGPPTYTFTSTKATTTPRTIYWDVSFSDADIPACAGLTPQIHTTPADTLTVLPPPPAVVTSTPVPAPVRVSILIPVSFNVAHPTVTYRVHCTASCTGDTYYRVVVRRHGKTIRDTTLDYDSADVFVTAASGGDEQFTRPYRGRQLHKLRALLHAGGVVEIEIYANVTGASGAPAQAHVAARLSR